MKKLIIIGSAIVLSACSSNYSYVEDGIYDDTGALASEIAGAVNRSASEFGIIEVNIAEPRRNDEFNAGVVSAMEASGISHSENADTLIYYVSRLYDGILVRVLFLGEITARFFRKTDSGLSGGQTTIFKGRT